MIDNVLRLFLDTLTFDETLYLLNRDNLTEPIQMQLSQKQKTFSEFFFALLKSILNLNICQKKMTLIGDVFPKIPAPKKMVR